MTTGATGQLGLALPVQGELSGTWGDTVNNGITQYTNIAIAATLTLTDDGAVTLANTTGDASASNIVSSLTGAGTVTAQFAIVRVTGTLTVAKVVTAPSYSKTYTVVNAATGGIVTFKAAGQTGVSVAVGESAFVYYNGTDYVKVSSTVATGVTSFTAGTTGFTPSTATTGAVTLAGTLATTNGGTGLTSFTSGGVVYASSSSALATGSALKWNGTNLAVGAGATTLGNVEIQATGTGAGLWVQTGGTTSASTIVDFRNGANAPTFQLFGDNTAGFYGNVGLGITPTTILDIGANNNTPKTITLRYSSVPTYLSSTFDGNFGLSTLSINSYNTSSGSASWSAFGNSGYASSAVQLASDTNGSQIRFLTASAVNTVPSERARFSAAGGFSVGTTADPGAGAIYATGNITAYYSDARLKTVSGKIENALDKVAQLSGVYYTNNDTAKSFGYDSDEVQVGVLAQDVEAVLPQIVKAAPFDLDENGNSKSGENYKTVQYERLVPLLIEAINELQAKVKLLENK